MMRSSFRVTLAVFINLLCFSLSITALEPKIRPLDFSQEISPNSDGQVEGLSQIFFNWGAFRTGFVYKSETIVQNYVDANQDTFVNQQTKTYNLIVLKTRDGLIGSGSFFINPFVGVKLIDRTEKRIGEDLNNNFWFTEESDDLFVNIYASADMELRFKSVDISLTVGGGYILKKTDGDFRNSAPAPDLRYTSNDIGFNFFSDITILLKPSTSFSVALSLSYNREASYYERYYIAESSQRSYAYYTHEFSYGIHFYLNFLKKVLNTTPYFGLTYIEYRREIQTGSREKFKNSRFKFDIGMKL